MNDYISALPCFDDELVAACDAQDAGRKALTRSQRRRAARIIQRATMRIRSTRPVGIKAEPPSLPHWDEE